MSSAEQDADRWLPRLPQPYRTLDGILREVIDAAYLEVWMKEQDRKNVQRSLQEDAAVLRTLCDSRAVQQRDLKQPAVRAQRQAIAGLEQARKILNLGLLRLHRVNSGATLDLEGLTLSDGNSGYSIWVRISRAAHCRIRQLTPLPTGRRCCVQPRRPLRQKWEVPEQLGVPALSPKTASARSRETHRSLLPLGLAQAGGAIYHVRGNADIKDCKFEGNTASDCRRVRSRQH